MSYFFRRKLSPLVTWTSASLLAIILAAALSEPTNSARSSELDPQASAGTASAGQAGVDVRQLEPGNPIAREIAGGERHHYRITIASGQYVRLVVSPRSIDVVVTLFGPDGAKLDEADSGTGGNDPLRLFVVTTASGSYQLEVRLSGKNAVPGRYEARIEELRVTTAQDGSRAAAERASAQGDRLRAQGKAESSRRAVEKYKEAIAHWEAAGDQRAKAKLLYDIGLVQRDLGQRQMALDYFRQALQLSKAARDGSQEAATLTAAGSVYNALGEKHKALDHYNESLPLSRALGDKSGEAITLNNIGAVYRSTGDMQKALEYFSQALEIHRALDNRKEQATTLNNLGLVYDSSGERLKALDYYNQALSLHRAERNHGGQATTLNNLGFVYRSLGELQKALDHYNEALVIYSAAGNPGGQAVTLNNIGVVYRLLGEMERALDFYNKALLLRQTAGDPRGEATTLSNIGAVYRTMGELQKALDFYHRAMPLRRQVKDQRGEANTLSNIGLVYHDLAENQKALDYLNQALTARRTLKDRSGEAYTLTAVGAVYNSLGEQDKALEYYGNALLLRRAVGDRQGEATTLYNIARAERGRDNLIGARTHIEAALEIIESLRTMVTSHELRASYLASLRESYQFHTDLLMMLHKRHPSEGYAGAALQASERSRARSLLEILAEAQADIRVGVDPGLLARARALQQQLNSKAEYQSRTLNDSHTEEQGAAIKKEIGALTAEYRDLQAQIRARSPRYAALTQPQPLNASEIQRQLLDVDTLLLEYALGSERSYLWVVSPIGTEAYELPRRKEIEEAASRLNRLLAARQPAQDETLEKFKVRVAKADAEYPAAAQALSQMLLGPVSGQLGTKRLLIVADGALHYVPFAALSTPETRRHADNATWAQEPSSPALRVSFVPLIADHEIVTLPSASALAVLRREIAGRKPAPKTVAVLADPVFDKDDDRFGADPRLRARSHSRREMSDAKQEFRDGYIQRAVREVGVTGNGATIPRLPFSREEAEAILALTPARKGMKATGFRASRATATSPELAQYRIVHFATHALVNNEHAELSGIVLSLVDEEGSPQDGFLRLHDLYNLNLPADLVVLSACQTALGKEIKGEGLVGLTRGFMYAGAARVMASLWKVDDAATAELMKRFYEKMLKHRMRPAAALRAAQLEMWRNRPWQAPYYWAAFVLQGEWQ